MTLKKNVLKNQKVLNIKKNSKNKKLLILTIIICFLIKNFRTLKIKT